ncbi:MAG: insulinase family protein [Acidobacteriia bacterium]|nr:insulinase family protein [Terriglobia bacterium]
MKLRLAPLYAAAVCAANLIAASQAPPKLFPYTYRQEDLPNGLRLVTVPTEFPHVVAVYIVVQAGSRNEVEPGHTGFAHLFEHLMFRGTEQYPAARYQAVLAKMGADSNAFTSNDYTCFYTTFSKEDLETVLAMESDRFQNLKYSEADFRTETLAVLGEYNKNSSNPTQKLRETIADTAFDRHTYKHTAMGFLKDIQDMPNQYQYSLRFFDHYYRPEYTTIIVTGDVKSKIVHDLVEKYWGQWKRGSFVAEIPAEPPQDKPRATQIRWPTGTLPLLSISYKTPAFTDSTKDTAALQVISLLAFSPASDLYQKLVIHDQKADQLSAENPLRADPDLFEIRARVKSPGNLDSVREEILETIAGLRQRPIDAARLTAAKKHLRYQLSLRMDNSDTIAEILASFIALRRFPEAMERFYAQLDRVTPEDLQQAASKYLVENGRTIVTLTGREASE